MGCRRRAAPDELIRIVARADGSLAVGRRLPGRGAWVCRDSDRCLELVARRDGLALARALRGGLEGDALGALRALVGPGHEPGAGVGG